MSGGNGGATEDHRALLLRAYAAFNDQDLEVLLECVTDDVDWPDGEARLHGKAAVRAYWTEQWTRVRAHDEPTGFEDLGGGRVAVRIDQAVRALDGSILSRGRFLHRVDIEDRRVTRLHIESLEAVS